MGLVVSLGSDKPQAVVGEMTGDVVGTLIAEQITDASKLDDFHPGWGAKGASLASAADDDKPMFSVIRVEEGWSRSRRLWTAKELDSIAEQTNALEPVGHLGHIKDEDAATSFPEPQTTWFGAFTKIEPSTQKSRIGEQVKDAYFAGYNLPGAKVRTYIKTKAVRGISWWGSGDLTPIPGKGVEVRNFALKALDWARKNAEGMPTSGVVATVMEMEGDKMDKALSQVTPQEFKAENPNGYALLVAEATKDADTKIGEMQAELDAAKNKLSLLDKACQLLGIEKPEDILTKLEEVQAAVGAKAKATVATALDKLLEEKIPGEGDDVKAKRELVKRLIPVAEMESAVSDKNADDAEKYIGEQVDEAFTKDEQIKSVIGEMQPPVVRRREELRLGGDKDGLKRERVTL